MSESEIIKAVDTRTELSSEKSDAHMPSDKQQKEVDISRAMPEVLVEVDEVMDELHAFCLAFPESLDELSDRLPESLSQRIRKLLSKEGLEELPQENRQEARLRILKAMGIGLEHSEHVTFVDKKLIGESELSPSEVEALYRRLESSTTFKYLTIDLPANASEKWEPESWRLFADIILGAQSLKRVYIEDQPLSGRALSQLAKAVAASERGPSPVDRVVIKHGLRNLQRSGGTTGSFNEEWAGNVANLTAAVPNLKRLRIGIGPFADEDVAELIGEAVASHKSLEELILWELRGNGDSGEHKSDGGGTSVPTLSTGKKKMGFSDRLLSRAFLGHTGNSSISTLSYVYYDKEADLEVLRRVLQKGIHLTKLELGWSENFLARDLRDFLKDLPVFGAQLQSLVLQEFDERVGEGLIFDTDSFAMLVEILKSKSMPALKHLGLNLYHSDFKTKAFDWPGFYSSLSEMESVSLDGYVGLWQAEKEVAEWIQASKALKKLDLPFRPRKKMNWRSIVHSLRENKSITELVVSSEVLEDDVVYRELMEVLHVNSTLQEIEFWDVAEDTASREATVREALKSKARQESYLAELQKGLGGGRAKWQSPKCGRIFLCGAPEAGGEKTLMS